MVFYHRLAKLDLAARMSFYYLSEAIGKVVTVYIMGVATEISGLSLAVPAFVMLCCRVSFFYVRRLVDAAFFSWRVHFFICREAESAENAKKNVSLI